MTKADLVKELKEKAGFETLAAAEKAYDSFLSVLMKNLKADGKCQINGFGSFAVVKRNARKGRNPQTGAELQIPARKAIKFTPAKALKDSVN